MSVKEKTDAILYRSGERQKMYERCLKMFSIYEQRGLRLIVENPYSDVHYLHRNFPYKPKLIDINRRRRGDYFIKPTQFWFLNCEPTYGESFQRPKETKNVRAMKCGIKQGVCSEERSMISPCYARNFICDFILGKEQKFAQQLLF